MSAAIHDATFGALQISQCTQAGFQANNQISAGRESGAIDPSALYLNSGEPRARWQTLDLATLLAGISINNGLYVSSGTISIPWRRRIPGAAFEGNSQHYRLSATKGLLIPSSIEASQGNAAATASVESVLISTDGLTKPVTSAINVTPASMAYHDEFRLGPVAVNEEQVPKVVGFTVTPNIQIILEYCDGGTYPTDVYIKQRDPTIDIRFLDERALHTYGPLFAEMTQAICFLRKKVAGATVLDDAEDEHISFSFADGIVSAEEIQGSNNETAEPTLRLHGEQLTVSTTAVVDVDFA